jgi:hypothetical protein
MTMLDPVTIKPFSKIVNFTGASSTTVTLTDTGGIPILCNYIQGTIAAAATNASYIHIIPSGLSPNPTVALGNAASGSLGLIGTLADPAEVFLGGADYCSAITLYSSAAVPVLITYGVRTVVNPLKSFGKYPGV